MANRHTIKRSLRICNRINKALAPLGICAGHVAFDSEGNLTRVIEAKNGKLKVAPMGLLERAFRMLPNRTIRQFASFTPHPVERPTAKEFLAFERNLLINTRRVLVKQVNKQIAKLKIPAGRPITNQEKIRLVYKTVKEELEKKPGLSNAVEETAKKLNGITSRTVWTYLRQTKIEANKNIQRRS